MSGRARAAVVLLFIAVAWIWLGHESMDRLWPDPRAVVAAQVSKLTDVDPQAGAALAKLAENHDTRVLAATIKMSGLDADLSALKRFARLSQGGGIPAELDLMLLADKQKLHARGLLDGYLTSHTHVIRVLNEVDKSGALASEHLARLKEIEGAATPECWDIALDDPVAVALRESIGDTRDLWSFYKENRDWLAPLLLQVATPGGDRAHAGELENHSVVLVWRSVLINAQRFDPLFKQAVVGEAGEGLGAVAAGMFETYGSLFEAAVALRIPLLEIMEVAFANPDYVQDANAGSPGSSPEAAKRVAAKLAGIRATNQHVWEAARRRPLALRLHDRSPQYADQVLQRYGDEDVTELLWLWYEDPSQPSVLIKATRAIAVQGDLAVYFLLRYKSDARMKRALNNDKVHVEGLIAFLATRNADDALDQVDDSPAWIDKYFYPDGKEKPGSFWKKVPLVGAPLNVGLNWLQGVPNEWGELGWAAWDVADSVLLVASFGTSKVVTEGAKAAIKKVTVTGVTSAEREAARSAGRSLLNRFASGARKGVSLSRYGEYAAQVGSIISKHVGPVAGFFRKAGTAAGEHVVAAWRAIPPGAQRWVLRGTSGAMLFVSFKERTIPHLPEMGAQLGEFVGSLLRKTAEAAVNTALSAAKAMLGWDSLGSGVSRFLVFWGVLALLVSPPLYLLWNRLRPSASQRIRPI